MPPLIETIDIKSDRPTVDEARRRLAAALEDARRRGVGVLKVVHGYGSSGVGGALKDAIRKSLRLRRKEGKVVDIVHGENWSVFEERVARLLDAHPGLRRDVDLERGNEGITVVVLTREA